MKEMLTCSRQSCWDYSMACENTSSGSLQIVEGAASEMARDRCCRATSRSSDDFHSFTIDMIGVITAYKGTQ